MLPQLPPSTFEHGVPAMHAPLPRSQYCAASHGAPAGQHELDSMPFTQTVNGDPSHPLPLLDPLVVPLVLAQGTGTQANAPFSQTSCATMPSRQMDGQTRSPLQPVPPAPPVPPVPELAPAPVVPAPPCVMTWASHPSQAQPTTIARAGAKRNACMPARSTRFVPGAHPQDPLVLAWAHDRPMAQLGTMQGASDAPGRARFRRPATLPPSTPRRIGAPMLRMFERARTR
jgi:hypothetical protein